MINNVGFFKQFGLAFSGFVKPSHFFQLRKQGFFKTLLYALIISILSISLFFTIFIISFKSNDVFKQWVDSLPTFSYVNGVLDLEKPVSISQNGVGLYIDTSIEYLSAKDASTFFTYARYNENTQVIMITKTNIIKYQGGAITDLKLSDMGNMFGVYTINNDNVIEVIADFLTTIFKFCAPFLIIIYLIVFLITGVIYALAGMIIGAVTCNSHSFGENYKMSLFISGFWVLIIRLVEQFIPTAVPINLIRFFVFIIVCVYLFLALGSKEPEQAPVVVINPNAGLDDDIVFEAPPERPTYSENISDNTSSTSTIDSSSGTTSTSKFKLKD